MDAKASTEPESEEKERTNEYRDTHNTRASELGLPIKVHDALERQRRTADRCHLLLAMGARARARENLEKEHHLLKLAKASDAPPIEV